MKRLLIVAALAIALGAQTRVNTIAEITGTGVAVQINTLLPGVSGFYPVPLPNPGYSLAQLYVYIPSGDKINVLWSN